MGLEALLAAQVVLSRPRRVVQVVLSQVVLLALGLQLLVQLVRQARQNQAPVHNFSFRGYAVLL